MKSADPEVLEFALRCMSQALNELISECIGADGKPQVPSRGTLMRSRGLLPPYCQYALAKGKNP